MAVQVPDGGAGQYADVLLASFPSVHFLSSFLTVILVWVKWVR